MPPRKHRTGKQPKKAGDVHRIKKSTIRQPTHTRKATQKQQVAVPKGTPAIPKHPKTTQEERPATRRSARIQQLTANNAKPSIFEELLPVKRPLRDRKANVIQPTGAALKARESKASRRLSQKGDQSPVDNPVLSQASKTRSKIQPVLSWLENVDSIVEENPQVSSPADSFEMPEYLSSVIEPPTTVSQTATSQKTAKPRPSPETFRRLLEARNAFPNKSSKDDRTKQFLSALRSSKPSTAIFDGTDELWALMSSLDEYKRNSGGNSSSREKIEQLIERMTDELHRWRTVLDLATITESEFNGDLIHCRDTISNEAELQRTLLPEILNRHQLKETFILRFEGQWKSQRTNDLPSADPMNNGISAPKPDLAIFFDRDVLGSSSAPIPHDMETSLGPEALRMLCFPFLFIEAKKKSDPLEPALDKNLHTANQALFNIFGWMEKAGKLDDFFENVRTVSIALNANEIIARIHRAEPSTGSLPLDYAYDDLTTIYKYTKKEACKLIRSILLEYGAQKLLETLKDTFQTVSGLYAKQMRPEDFVTKWESDNLKPTSLSKRTRSKSKSNQADNSQKSDSEMLCSTSEISLSDA